MKVTPDIKKQIVIAADTHPTMQQAAESLGMIHSLFAYHAKKLGVYKPNQGGKGIPCEAARIYSTQDILEGKHPQSSTLLLKNRLFDEGYKQRCCEECGQMETWNGKPLKLELDHVNGINDDHRLCNLRIVCPNCHTQTDTYKRGNKNTSKKYRDNR